MPDLPQGRVAAIGDFPINEGIIPMFASTSVKAKRFVKFDESNPRTDLDDLSIEAYGATVGSTADDRCVGVTMNEITYPNDQVSAGDASNAFQIIDPGQKHAQVSVFTEGIVLVEKATGASTAIARGKTIRVGSNGLAVASGSTEAVGFAFSTASNDDQHVQVKLCLGLTAI